MHLEELEQFLERHTRNPVGNYIVPGLTSMMIDVNMVRIFTMSRAQELFIHPHSHRFDFAAMVISGTVDQTLYIETDIDSATTDWYSVRYLKYGDMGKYDVSEREAHLKRFRRERTRYNPGDWYRCTANEIHSVQFSKGALVLFLEGRNTKDITTVLEPGVESFRIEPWMFQRGVCT